ncbi:hypothetical protein FB561_0033 [Kribbella amoyensis]|uniref:Uncharacterized protein n=1 Tax=Kribbella amoyensis TaxID=996641 RepID=A0A561BJH7_9ACTN|nr:hypothetical protein [Kribbella amoyensis]TWD78985.1 hypothetical protein FB561_0033 [Kribbella amoyensis]
MATKRRVLLAAVAVLALTVFTGCTFRVGDPEEPDPVFGQGSSVRWDLTRPIEAKVVGLPADEMEILEVPDDATVTFTLPTDAWSGRIEDMTVTTRHGYLDTVDIFWTEADGQAAADRMVADAEVLGVDAARVAGWAGIAQRAETAGTHETTEKANYNGSNGRVSTAMKPSMRTSKGKGTPVRLFYRFYLRNVVEKTEPGVPRTSPTR